MRKKAVYAQTQTAVPEARVHCHLGPSLPQALADTRTVDPAAALAAPADVSLDGQSPRDLTSFIGAFVHRSERA